MDKSKPLKSDDISAFEFVKESLKGNPTSAINFDRIQYDYINENYVIIEYLLCDEKQFSRGITPFTSHPNRYFLKNSMKFISLWKIAQELNASLYFVNYSKKGTQYENEVLVMKVLSIDETKKEPVLSENIKMSRLEFSKWLIKLNSQGFIKKN